MDERVARQEAINIVATTPLRPEALLRTEGRYNASHEVRIRYVPDRYRLPEGSFQNYLLTLPDTVWHDISESAFVIMDDLSNQLVPKWIQVMVQTATDAALVEDRQPQWQNAALLSRQVIF
ncbi:MAG: hypothetical protein HRT36_04195 [Alphaproteobacteria bacterium]|nr:hypothetical protein [Alphaproteobacteria bacterium]